MGLQIIAIDTGDEKKKMCEELGSHAFVDFAKSSNVVKDVQAATEDGLGPHAVILVAVSEKPFQQAAEVGQHISLAFDIPLYLINTDSMSDRVGPLFASVFQQGPNFPLQFSSR